MDACPVALYSHLYTDLLPLSSEFIHRPEFNSDQRGELPEVNQSVPSFTADRMLRLWNKKYFSSRSDACDSAALDKFLSFNQRCEEWELTLETELDSLLFGEFKSCLRKALVHEYYGLKYVSESSVSLNMRVGPGSAIGALDTSEYSKLASSPLTATSSCLLDYFKRISCDNPLLKEAIDNRDPYMQDYVVQGNKLAFVPKNDTISRTICIEPSVNVLFQQGVRYGLETCLRKEYNIDFSDFRVIDGVAYSSQQDINRRLAQIGSVDGSYSTIDLASASDSISMGLCKKVLPLEILNFLIRYRSPSVTLPDGSVRELHMVSSMGNAFTFPLQTLLFSCVVHASYNILDIKLDKGLSSLPNFTVFGDDIVCLSKAYDFVIRLLKILGFVPNDKKSFNSGYFRESCGHDYYHGHRCEPVYIRDLSSNQDIASAYNRLVAWSARNAIPLASTLGYLRKIARKNNIPCVPCHEACDAGIYSTFDYAKKTKQIYFDKNTFSYAYTAYASHVSSIKFDSPESFQESKNSSSSKKIRKLLRYNAAGVLFSGISGSLRDSSMAYRQATKYRKVVRKSSCWSSTYGNAIFNGVGADSIYRSLWLGECSG